MRPLPLVCAAALIPLLAPLTSASQPAPPAFRRHVLSSGLVLNSVVAVDINRDGRLDVAAAGPEEVAWYERAAGAWTNHVVRRQSPQTGSLDTIWLVPHDIDGDGDPDLLAS